MTLTKRQKEVLDYLVSFETKHGYAQSFEEIGKGLKLTSLATVHKHISTLEKTAGRYAGSPSFSLDDPSVIYYSPSPTGGLPLDLGDYVAVAVKRAMVPNAQFVALAYRKLWVGESAHALNAWWPASCAVIGAIMFGLWSTNGIKHPGDLAPILSFGSLGAFEYAYNRISDLMPVFLAELESIWPENPKVEGT